MISPKIKSAAAIKKYILHIVFDDGTEGDYNANHLAGQGVFKSWDVDDNFFKVNINTESGTITWPGNLDIDIINIYCGVKNINIESYLTTEQYAAY